MSGLHRTSQVCLKGTHVYPIFNNCQGPKQTTRPTNQPQYCGFVQKANIFRSKLLLKMILKYFLKWFWIFVKVACSVAFTIQISASVYYQLAPEKRVAETVTTNLKNIDFPVAFKVCIKPSFNDTELSMV